MIGRNHPLQVRFMLWVTVPLLLSALLAVLYVRKSLPVQGSDIRLPGLAHSVSVLVDAHGVPHITATSDDDAFFALGYVHAQNRMWQMESQRRIGQGRLSEIAGAAFLQSDKYMRTLGLARVARQNLLHLDTNSVRSLQAYAKGVNAWIGEQHVLPIEFQVLGFRPEAWQPEDSLLQIKLMALSLDRNYRLELVYSLWTKLLGAQRTNELRAGYPNSSAVVTQAHAAVPKRDLDRLLTLNARTEDLFRLGGEGAGSNAWVISGQYTSSGKPLLANDPHLKTQLPSVWYLAELQGDRLHVAGATIPGLPLVLTGHNQSIAWGVTALNADTQDVFLERTHIENDNLYEVDGQWMPVQFDRELIQVRAEFPAFLNKPLAPVPWLVRRTRHGPLISDAAGQVDVPMALRWSALNEADISYSAFLAINHARDWTEFRAALEYYTAPTLNFVYADRGGNIGYAAGGEVPLRKSGDGSLPVPGWNSAFEWTGTIPRAELPHSFNPTSGYIVTANNKIHDDSYLYFVSRDWAPGYRADRITSLIAEAIAAGRAFTVQSMVNMQGDSKNSQAAQLLSLFTGVTTLNERQQRAIEYLRQWDLRADESSIAASIYHAWLARFSRSILDEAVDVAEVPPARRDVGRDALSEQLYPMFLNDVVNGNLREWCDIRSTSSVESCRDRALQALDPALEDLERLAGSDMRDWQWGSLHRAHYPHGLFTNVKVLDAIFDRSIAHGGDAYTVAVAGSTYSKDRGYRDTVGPSYRQVIDLADWNASRFISNTGQSGNILSAHYDDFMLLNKELKLAPMTFGKAREGSSMQLLPAGE